MRVGLYRLTKGYYCQRTDPHTRISTIKECGSGWIGGMLDCFGVTYELSRKIHRLRVSSTLDVGLFMQMGLIGWSSFQTRKLGVVNRCGWIRAEYRSYKG